jgi:lipopolysaccharide export LptBFGC system permease protein LptF
MLGKAVFRDLRDPGVLQYPVRPDFAAVFWYNGLHLLVSVAIGLVVVALIEHAERHPARARLILIIIVGGFFVTILGVGLLTAPMRPVLPWWSIVVANGLATLLAAFYLLRRRPGLWGRLSGSADAARGEVVT